MSALRATTAAVLIGAMVHAHSVAHAAACESLQALQLPQTTVTAAALVASGAFSPPAEAAEPRSSAAWKRLDAFCRVQGVIAPTAGSHIEFEVWLPERGWNGRYYGTGNGGLAGSINYRDMAAALGAGLATSSTDTGHRAQATDGAWAEHHPQKIIDYAYRAIHLTALDAKAIVHAFYGSRPTHSYFSSCSNGGRQALIEAQRYPDDYDGIIAGAPAIAISRTMALFHSDQLALQGRGFIPPAKYAAIEAAVLAACDGRDGDKDGIVDEPLRCKFDPEVLRCSDADSDRCLTQPQIEALERIYSGPRTHAGAQIYPGLLPGGESGPLGWGLWVSGPEPGKSLEAAFLSQGGPSAFFGEPGWDYATTSVDDDIRHPSVDRLLDAGDADLTAFGARGGKLILYHGWSDAAIPPYSTIDYYTRVQAKLKPKETDSFVRLYMAPGMQHCGGGPGPNTFDMNPAIEAWVEQGAAPAAIVATRPGRSRPLCPYPQVARWKGSGSTDDAANFTCVMPDTAVTKAH